MPRKSSASPPEPDASAEHAFVATLRREGPLYLVDVPLRVSRALGTTGRIPVVITVRGARPIQATLVPRGGGAHKVFLNGEVRSAAGVELGGKVALSVRFDDESREVDTPPDLASALDEAAVLPTFARYTAGKRRHILDWVDEVQSEEARERRIAKVVERIVADHERHLDREARKTPR